MSSEAKYIDHYLQDGFVKVCDVDPTSIYEWRYTNIDHEVMYSDHTSWIYFITLNKEIKKIGESGNPLGIAKYSDDQPASNSKSRLGRYRGGDGTDSSIRYELREDIKKGNEVSIWAKKCQIYSSEHTLAGKPIQVNTTIHKALELHYLDYFKSQVGHKPVLNKSRK